MADMAIREYRFTITGNLTVDDRDLRKAMMTFDIQASPDAPPMPEEEKIHRQFELLEQPPLEQMRTYLHHGHFRLIGPAIVQRMDKDMPGIGYQIDPVQLTDVVVGYGYGDPDGFRPVRPEDR